MSWSPIVAWQPNTTEQSYGPVYSTIKLSSQYHDFLLDTDSGASIQILLCLFSCWDQVKYDSIQNEEEKTSVVLSSFKHSNEKPTVSPKNLLPIYPRLIICKPDTVAPIIVVISGPNQAKYLFHAQISHQTLYLSVSKTLVLYHPSFSCK